MRGWMLVLAFLALVAGCGSGEPAERSRPVDHAPQPAVMEAEEPDWGEFTDEARAATGRLQLELEQELADAMEQGGAAGAVEVCSRRATELTAEVSERTGLHVRRVSVSNRNPDNRASTGEAAVLALMAARPALSDTTLVRDGEPFYMRAIRINTPLCLQCHGPSDALAQGVAERLAQLYEDDRATGFSEGDLRGAFVVRRAD